MKRRQGPRLRRAGMRTSAINDSASRKLTKRLQRVAEPAEMPRTEWDFSRCPIEELFQCRAYEYARNSNVIIEDVKSLRKGVPFVFDDMVRVLRKRIDEGPRIFAVFWYYPEFPTRAYLTIPIKERRRRSRALWGAAVSQSVILKPTIIPVDVGRRLSTERLLYDSLELALFKIDWTESNASLADAFLHSLEENRPAGVKPFQTRGAGNWTRRWSDDLKALGAKRLLERMSWYDAFTLTKSEVRKKSGRGRRAKGSGLYGDREEAWRRAARRADSLIAAMAHPYISNKID